MYIEIPVADPSPSILISIYQSVYLVAVSQTKNDYIIALHYYDEF